MKIELKKWTSEDAKRMAEICNAIDLKYLTNRIPHPYHEEDAHSFLEYVFSREGKDSLFRAIVVDDVVIGNISVEGKSDVFVKDCEIGYFILADYYNQGITSQAVKEICKLAFEELDINRISATVYEPNIASQKVLEKNGFQKEGQIRKGVYKNDTFYDLYYYGKLKEEM